MRLSVFDSHTQGRPSEEYPTRQPGLLQRSCEEVTRPRSTTDLPECLALPVPPNLCGNASQTTFGDGVTGAGIAWKKQQAFLEIRRQQRQRHDLRDACARDVAEARQISVVADLAA